jgi:hypothetical protein
LIHNSYFLACRSTHHLLLTLAAMTMLALCAVSAQAQIASRDTEANAPTVAGPQRLRASQPIDWVVLQAQTDRTMPTKLGLEYGGRLVMPSRPTTIAVFGSVFNTSSYLYVPEKTSADYLCWAGGPTKGTNKSSIFVMCANCEVLSNRPRSGSWMHRGHVVRFEANPGGTAFVPEVMDKTTLVQAVKDWTQVLYQFGAGFAGMKSGAR